MDMTVGKRIRHEREAQKISRAELARYAGIASTTLSDLELGESKTTTKLHKIAARLGVRPEWLETGKGVKAAAAPSPAAPSHSARFDPSMVAVTARALKIVLARRGATFDLEEDAELFVEAYAELENMSEMESVESNVAFGAKVADLVLEREARRNGRQQGEQTSSTDRGKARKQSTGK